MKPLFSLLAFLTAAPLFATTFTATTCSLLPTGQPPATSISSPSSCAVTDPVTGAAARADAQVAFTFSNNGGFNNLRIEQNVYTQFGPYPRATDNSGVEGDATSQVSYSDAFATAGPIRAGYIEFQVGDVFNKPYAGRSSLVVTLAPFDANLPLPTLLCDSGICQFGYYLNHPKVPYILGTQFVITADGQILASAGFNDGTSGGNILANFGIRFFEADGVTPVALSEAPEPTTLALLGISAVIALLVKCR